MSIAKSAKIAKTAIIEDGAIIGENVEIGHFCVIGANVKIGANTLLHNNVTLAGYSTFGEGNEIFPYASLGTKPQDLKYAGEKTELIIGNRNKIREFTMFSPGTVSGCSKTTIGDDNLLMAYVHIAHDCIIGNHCIIANAVQLGGHIEIGNFVNIGGLSAVHQFVKIGDYAMLGGASALGQDIPPFCLAEGRRATIKMLNKHRMRKVFENRAEIDKISAVYKILFSGSASIKELAKDILAKEEDKASQIGKICTFILNSTRGIPFERGNVSDE